MFIGKPKRNWLSPFTMLNSDPEVIFAKNLSALDSVRFSIT